MQYILAITEGLCDSLFAITVGLLSPFDRHVHGAQMVLKLEINRTLRGWQGDLFNLFLPRNLIDLGDVLVEDSV